jgi:hypothetical protein
MEHKVNTTYKKETLYEMQPTPISLHPKFGIPFIDNDKNYGQQCRITA